MPTVKSEFATVNNWKRWILESRKNVYIKDNKAGAFADCLERYCRPNLHSDDDHHKEEQIGSRAGIIQRELSGSGKKREVGDYDQRRKYHMTAR